MLRLTRRLSLLIALLPWGARTGVAQSRMDEPSVTAGALRFSEGSALKSAVFAGLETSLPWTTVAAPRYLRGLAISTRLAASLAFPRTDGTQFALVAVDAGDTTRFTARSQRVGFSQLSGDLRFALPAFGGRVFVGGGAGAYAVWMARRPGASARARFGPLAAFGGGYEHVVASRIALRAEARTIRYFAFDRSALDVTSSYASATLVRDALRPPPTSRTQSSSEISLAVRVTPRAW